MPDFLIIGAAKAGTTSLYHYLAQHPDISMSPVKEPSFFAYEGHPLDFAGPRDQEIGAGRFAVTRLEDYQALFAGRSGQRAAGEASPFYLYHDEAPARIARYIPDARLVAVLRDPAERAFSNYVMFVRDCRETLDFRAALAQCERRRRDNWTHGWQYLGLGFYARQLARYYALFRPEQIRVLFYEDLVRDPRGFVRGVLEFLGVDAEFAPELERRHNVSRIKRQGLDRLLNRPNRLKTAARALLPGPLRAAVRGYLKERLHYRPRLGARDRRYLIQIYRDDILELQRLTGRDLSAWLR